MKRAAIVIVGLIATTATAQVEYNVAGQTDAFAFKLYQQLAREARDNNNLFFSPYSISLALGMTYAGARSETEHEMATALSFPPNELKFHHQLGKTQGALLASGSQGVEITIANMLWVDKHYKFRARFLRQVKKAYGAPVQKIDFRFNPEPSRLTINSWVEKQTRNKIKNLLPGGSITDLTTLVLTNAIQFKGLWDDKFKPEDTHTGAFYPNTIEKVECSMMRREGKFHIAIGHGYRMLEIPYAGREFSMIIILPDEGLEMQRFEGSLSPEGINFLSQRLTETEVRLIIPRFRLDMECELKPTLSALGMPLAFSNLADFTRMSARPDLKIDEVFHKAFIEVSEEGTQAAAATAVVMVRKAMPLYHDFIVNRPFVFLIQHNASGITLFMGRVSKPTF